MEELSLILANFKDFFAPSGNKATHSLSSCLLLVFFTPFLTGPWAWKMFKTGGVHRESLSSVLVVVAISNKSEGDSNLLTSLIVSLPTNVENNGEFVLPWTSGHFLKIYWIDFFLSVVTECVFFLLNRHPCLVYCAPDLWTLISPCLSRVLFDSQALYICPMW